MRGDPPPVIRHPSSSSTSPESHISPSTPGSSTGVTPVSAFSRLGISSASDQTILHSQLANVASILARTPANVRSEYSAYHSVRLCENQKIVDPLSGLRAAPVSESSCIDAANLFNRFANLQVLGDGKNNFGLVLRAQEKHTGRICVVKLEALRQEEWMDDNESMCVVDRSNQSPFRDLVAHVQLNRCPEDMQWNTILLYDWTRVFCDLHAWMLAFNCSVKSDLLKRLGVQAYPMPYQVMILELAAGSLGSLMVCQQEVDFYRAVIGQTFTTLARFHSRLDFEHNDLTLDNILYSPVGVKHTNRFIYYELPGQHAVDWIRIPLTATGNRVMKLNDFGLARIRYYVTDRVRHELVPKMTTWEKDYINEEKKEIQVRFDPVFFLQQLANKCRRFLGQRPPDAQMQLLLRCIDYTQTTLAPLGLLADESKIYKPENVLRNCGHFNDWLVPWTEPMSEESIAELRNNGDIVVFANDILTSNDYREINAT